MPSHGGRSKEMLEATRKRARAIDSYIDMIPARFYFGADGPELDKCLDPAMAKGTSTLIKEYTVASAASSSAAPGKKKREETKT